MTYFFASINVVSDRVLNDPIYILIYNAFKRFDPIF